MLDLRAFSPIQSKENRARNKDIFLFLLYLFLYLWILRNSILFLFDKDIGYDRKGYADYIGQMRNNNRLDIFGHYQALWCKGDKKQTQ